MPVSDYLHASGILRFKGQAGKLYSSVGQIYVSNAPKHGIDQNLWAILKLAVDELGLVINVNSIDTGTHVPTSRHYDGRAADINKVGVGGSIWRQATLLNSDAMRLVTWLRAHGFKVGEGAPHPAILFGSCGSAMNPTKIDHSTHLHVSLPRAPGDVPGDEEEPTEDV